MEKEELKRLSEEYARKICKCSARGPKYIQSFVYGITEGEWMYDAFGIIYPALVKIEKAKDLLKDGSKEGIGLLDEVCENYYKTITTIVECIYQRGGTDIFKILDDCIREKEEEEKKQMEMKIKAF